MIGNIFFLQRMSIVLAVMAVVVCGCNGDDDSAGRGNQAIEPTYTLDFNLDLDVPGRLALDVTGDDVDARIELEEGTDLVPGGTAIEGAGRLHRFPEATYRLYTARMQGPAVEAGPCGEAPVSLALSLSEKDESGYLAGSLTAYCGEGVYEGAPARVMRIAGRVAAGE